MIRGANTTDGAQEGMPGSSVSTSALLLLACCLCHAGISLCSKASSVAACNTPTVSRLVGRTFPARDSHNIHIMDDMIVLQEHVNVDAISAAYIGKEGIGEPASMHGITRYNGRQHRAG